jgi:hypothetical protein
MSRPLARRFVGDTMIYATARSGGWVGIIREGWPTLPPRSIWTHACGHVHPSPTAATDCVAADVRRVVQSRLWPSEGVEP